MYVPPPRSVSSRRTAALDRAASTALGVSSRATTPPLATSVRVGVGRTKEDSGTAAHSSAAEPVARRRTLERRDGIESDVAGRERRGRRGVARGGAREGGREGGGDDKRKEREG